MSDYQEKTSERRAISGILSDWAIVTFSHNGKPLVNEDDLRSELTLLMGDVDIDYKHRFLPGSHIKTSYVMGFNKADFTVTTKNSFYQLNGRGYEVVADVRFYSLFMDYGFSPTQIIEEFPRLISDCSVIEADPVTFHEVKLSN